MGTKNKPGSYDCYERAEPDEPMFILLARDPQAPSRVYDWARTREEAIQRGDAPSSDIEKVREARACAKAMFDWRKEHRK